MHTTANKFPMCYKAGAPNFRGLLLFGIVAKNE